ncbi:hypothetical protein [Streptomyces griseorubiginosus]|uniref:hypothetical protein n=1 Tax=Streptomyces griseorubiginosus TaxID=67304 RepID=UPI001AD76938|nr:hypothetical protein [Streptomyces griseorubiginosus]MBO4254459.1 hypothetical protein [Streptomyces griseorubiginosus]
MNTSGTSRIRSRVTPLRRLSGDVYVPRGTSTPVPRWRNRRDVVEGECEDREYAEPGRG